MLSVVVPLFNEAESLATLHAELAEMAERHDYDLEILFVDDGSTDRSWQEIQRLAQLDPRARGIRFRRNFGKAAALSAGFAAAQGELIVTIDADLQDDLRREIPQLLAVMAEGYDVVSGWKKVRHDPWHKVFPSHVFNGLVSWLTGVPLHDHNCGLKAYRLPKCSAKCASTANCIGSCPCWGAKRPRISRRRGGRAASAAAVRAFENTACEDSC